ncbi:MAG: hypothetical protein H6679_04175 [Epsilonproteobacteria bacterium]|nr:hypothetical protein [Campylobacterota bacterium]
MTQKCVVLVIVFFIGIYSLGNSAHCLHVTCASDVENILQSKKIWLHMQLEQTERGIVKDSLRFSIDTPCVTLQSWRATRNPVVVYDQAFRKNKKLLIDSCDCWLQLDFVLQQPMLCEQSLRQSCVYVACLVCQHDNTTMPVNVCVPLWREANVLACECRQDVCDDEFLQSNTCAMFINQRQDAVDGEFKILDTLERNWREVRCEWEHGLRTTTFKKYYVLLIMVMFAYLMGLLWLSPLARLVVIDFLFFDCGKVLLFVWLLCTTTFLYSIMPVWFVRMLQLLVVFCAASYFSISALYATFLKRKWYGLLGSILFSSCLPLCVRVIIAFL